MKPQPDIGILKCYRCGSSKMSPYFFSGLAEVTVTYPFEGTGDDNRPILTTYPTQVETILCGHCYLLLWDFERGWRWNEVSVEKPETELSKLLKQLPKGRLEELAKELGI